MGKYYDELNVDGTLRLNADDKVNDDLVEYVVPDATHVDVLTADFDEVGEGDVDVVLKDDVELVSLIDVDGYVDELKDVAGRCVY